MKPDSIPAVILAGILAAMDWAAALGQSRILTVPADTPFLPRDLVARLTVNAGEADYCGDFCLAASAGHGRERRLHPICGIWPIRTRDDLRASLLAGKRKVLDFAQKHKPAFAVWDYEILDPFFNVNSPEGLAQAERLLLHDAED